MSRQPLANTGASGKGIIAEGSDYIDHLVDPRSPVAFLPIDYSQFVAADDFRRIDLTEI
jgi:hypothetical protein